MANTTEVRANPHIDTDTSDGYPPAAETVPSDVRVFSSPELLEGILSQLPVLDLVIATGVSKTFRNVIQTSPRLQRQLFVLPTNDKPEYWKLVKRDITNTPAQEDDYESDDHLDALDTLRVQLASDYINTSNRTVQTAPSRFLVAVPSDTDDGKPSRRPLQVVSLCSLLSRPLQTPYLFKILSTSTSFEVKLDARASITKEPWSHMLLSNPPIKTVSYDLTWESRVHDTWDAEFTVTGRFHCEEGITFANLKNYALSKRGHVVVRNGIGGLRYPHITDPQASVGEYIEDTTLQEQIAAFHNQYSECVVQMKADESSFVIVSKVAPTKEEYEQMSTLCRIKTSVSRDGHYPPL
jgi:hypothetical protein